MKRLLYLLVPALLGAALPAAAQIPSSPTVVQNLTVVGAATGGNLPSTVTTSGLASASLSAGVLTINGVTIIAGANTTITASGTTITISSAGGGSGVASLTLSTANGIGGVVANPTTTPSLTLTLGSITPTSVATGALSGSTLSLSGAATITAGALITGSASMGAVSPSSITNSGIYAGSGAMTVSGAGTMLTITDSTASANPFVIHNTGSSAYGGLDIVGDNMTTGQTYGLGIQFGQGSNPAQSAFLTFNYVTYESQSANYIALFLFNSSNPFEVFGNGNVLVDGNITITGSETVAGASTHSGAVTFSGLTSGSPGFVLGTSSSTGAAITTTIASDVSDPRWKENFLDLPYDPLDAVVAIANDHTGPDGSGGFPAFNFRPEIAHDIHQLQGVNAAIVRKYAPLATNLNRPAAAGGDTLLTVYPLGMAGLEGAAIAELDAKIVRVRWIIACLVASLLGLAFHHEYRKKR